MPTGYTDGILTNEITTFEQFAKTCMRAFGATIHMRDESLDKEYEPRTPGDYHINSINNLKKTLETVKSSPDEDLIAGYRIELALEKTNYLNKIIETQANAIKLLTILEEVKKWEPPTPDHVGIKDFMIQQLESTLDYDGKTDYYEDRLSEIDEKLNNVDAKKIRQEEISQLESSLKYHTEQLEKEIERCNESNKWVEVLLESLK